MNRDRVGLGKMENTPLRPSGSRTPTNNQSSIFLAKACIYSENDGRFRSTLYAFSHFPKTFQLSYLAPICQPILLRLLCVPKNLTAILTLLW